jgi:hypothetical protein
LSCATAEAALDSVVKYDFSPSELAVIEGYVVIFQPFFKAEVKLRFENYYPPTEFPPESGTWDHHKPTLWVDGLEEQTDVVGDVDSMRTVYRNMVSARRAVASPLAMDMEVEYGAREDTGSVQVEVVATDPIAFLGLHLRLAIIENGLNVKTQYDQVFRDYFPNQLGIPFSIAQGDTFGHSQDFVIDAAWVAENCKIVAYVQDDTTREVVQAGQRPVVPVPAEVAELTVTLVESDLRLEWSPVFTDTDGHPLAVDSYRIYRDTLAAFPGPDSLFSTADTFYVDGDGVVGDPGTHYYYSVTAVAGGKESDYSGIAGEFDRDLTGGK